MKNPMSGRGHTTTYLASLVCLLVLGMTGCNQSSDKNVQPKAELLSAKMATKMAAAGQVQESAEKFSRIGEILLTTEGLLYADEMFDKALEINPNNNKANIYSALTKVLFKFKGFTKRAENFMSEGLLAEVQEFKDEVKDIPEVDELFNTMPAGVSTFKNYQDMSLFLLNEVLPEVEKSIEKLDRVSGATQLLLNLNKYETEVRYENYCYEDNGSWSCYDYYSESNSGPFSTPEKITVRSNELKVAKVALMAWTDKIKLLTAYSLDGSKMFMKRVKALNRTRSQQGKSATVEEVIQLIKEFSNLLTINSEARLVELRSGLEATLTNVLEMAGFEGSLCQQYGSSWCLSPGQNRQMSTTLSYLGGPRDYLLGYDQVGRPIFILVDITALLDNPVGDLKDLLPTEFDILGRPSNYPDKTFGGVIVNGDLFERLNEVY
jgi:hypothetical protein